MTYRCLLGLLIAVPVVVAAGGPPAILPDGAVARYGTTAWRTGDPVTALAVAPGGKVVASAVGTRVALWNVETGVPVRHLDGVQRGCRTLAFSPDGKLLAAGDDYGPVRVWDVATGKERLALAAHSSPVYAVKFSPDGKTLATGGGVGRDKKFCLWDVATGNKLHEVTKYADGQWLGIVGALAFSPDGKLIAAQTEWGQAGVWDVATGAEACKLIGPQPQVLGGIAFVDDGKAVAVFQGSRARVFQMPTGKELRQTDLPLGRDHPWGSFAFLPDGNRLLTGGSPVRAWDWPAGTAGKVFPGDAPLGSVLAVCPDGRLLAAGGLDGAIQVWDLGTGKRLNPDPGHTRPVVALAFSPDDKHLAAGDASRTVRLWDRHTGKANRSIDLTDGRPFAWVGPDPTNEYTGYAIAFTPDGRHLVSGAGGIRVWEVESGKKVLEIPLTGTTPFAVSGNGTRLLVSGWDRTTREYALALWDLPGGREIRRYDGHRDARGGFSMPIRCVALTADGATLASADGRGTIRLWDDATGRQRQELSVSGVAVNAIAFSADGRLLLAAGADGTVRQWSVADGKELRVLAGHDGPVAGLAVEPTGRRFITTGQDGTVLLRELASGGEVRRYHGHDGRVGTTAITVDGKHIASAGKDTSILVWDAGPRGPGPANLEDAWTKLADKDAARADRAHWALVAGGEKSVAFLAEHLRPVAGPDRRKLAAWVDQLDSARYAERERAQVELARLGPTARDALRERLKGEDVSADLRARIERLLEGMSSTRLPEGETLRACRAIAVLEAVQTPAARKLLEELAAGAGWDRQTDDARSALKRLAAEIPAR